EIGYELTKLKELTTKSRNKSFNFLERINLFRIRLASRIAYYSGVRDVMYYLFASLSESFEGNEKSYFLSEVGRRVADEFDTPFRKEMYVFHALLASSQGRSDEQDAWSDAVRVVSEGAQWERLGESRSVVMRVSNNKFFSRVFVFKLKSSIDDVLSEAEACNTLSDVLSCAQAPRPLYAGFVDCKPALVTGYIDGRSLSDIISGGDDSSVVDLIPTLARIHSRFPKGSLKRLDLQSKLESKLDVLKVPSSMARYLIGSLEPLEFSFDQVPWVWNKDAHPENWVIGDDVGVIDCEGSELVPCTFDLANLLDYQEGVSDEVRQSALDRYLKSLCSEGISVDGKSLKKAYFNSVVYRMICFAGAWSDSSRKNMRKRRTGAVLRGLNALLRLEQEFPDYFFEHRREYSLWRSGLNMILRLSYVS
ncbi:hypothetical protein D6825_03235, partial [Candidatus Woesearchaeota archaeon]